MSGKENRVPRSRNGAKRVHVEPREQASSLMRSTVCERPIPFVLLRCVTWLDAGDIANSDNVELRFWRRAGLTGNVGLTTAGQDVGFSDMDVT